MAINLTNATLGKLKKITEGGEAEIFEYEKNTILKLYKPHVNMKRKQKKVERFLQLNFPAAVIAPQQLVFQDGKFIGYQMQKVSDTENLHQLVKNVYLRSMNLTNKDVLEMMLNIGRDMNTLHKNGILIGDVSDYNILMKGKEIYFIDVDSWGMKSIYTPDAYTEIFTDPNNYNVDGTIKFSLSGEQYSFAVLSFNMLSRIHPFNGTYEKEKSMSTVERMKKKISVCGKHPIIIPKMIPSWKWMSPNLQEAYLEIFEKEKRLDIVPLLEEQFQNSKYCSAHQVYYYGKYNECPLCNKTAHVMITPKILQVQKENTPQVKILFYNNGISTILDKTHYLSKDGFIVHIPSQNRIKFIPGTRLEFSDDGKFIFIIKSDMIQIYEYATNILVSTLERSSQTPYKVNGKELYYIAKNGMLSKVTVSEKGCMLKNISLVYQGIFEISENGETWLGSFYPKKAIIKIQNYNFELSYESRIREYAIKHDSVSNKWLFIYETTKGTHRTIVFGNKKIEYDSETIRYQAVPLLGICFYNQTIYEPSAGKIIGINYLKNQIKEFKCDIVSEDSKLFFDGRKFTIINLDKVYTFGG